ncbi:hypothetical protein RN001_004972 [Aquatica leii]|uniref:Deltamethrin resistance protein prag01 domain-containing protein n=1 Tax=Aquatica leii TaxID=1421715 RepID=A0AAN7SPQ3_9COLE|nr:hypothetical protein RN001_004972 [Aquatica leii]
MNRTSSFLKTIVLNQVPRRTKAYTGPLKGSMNDLPQPSGSWKIYNEAKQRKYNAHLFGGIAFLIVTIAFGQATGCFFLNSTPKLPADKINYSNKDDDKDTVVSDSCWEPQHRTDSRKWLIRDGSYKLPREDASETRITYQVPQPDDRKYQGIRRIRHRDKMVEKITNDLIEEEKAAPPVEAYCTEYDANFHYPNYDPNKEKERSTDVSIAFYFT